MIKVIVERKSTGDTKEYRRHYLIEIVIMYVAAAVYAALMIAVVLWREYMLALCFLSYSYIFFAKGREWDRQNLLIEFVVDLSQALTEKTEEGGDDE